MTIEAVPDDRELVARAKKGEREALERLFSKYQDDLYRFSLRLMWSDSTRARDLAQDTLLTAYARLGSFRGKSSFRTWLFGIAVNLYRNYLRRMKTRHDSEATLVDIDAVSCGADEVVAGNEEHELLQEAFSGIAAGQREAVYLRDILGCTYEETATILGISQSAVKNRIHNGRENIRQAIRGKTGLRRGKDRRYGRKTSP